MRQPLRVLLVLAAAIAAPPAQEPVPPDSVARLIDLWNLPRLEPGVRCRQFASTDPSGNGEDHGHYLRREGDVCVLAEMDGPGVIARLWSANAAGRLLVFVDGEPTPRLDAPFADLFTGKLPPLLPPLAVHQSGGFVSYFPIPYAKSCRVEVRGLEHPDALYYHVQYLTYPRGTPLRSFTRELPPAEREALQRVLAAWSAPGASPVPAAAGDEAREGTAALLPGARADLFVSDRPGTVLSLRLDVAPRTPAALRALQLFGSWDGASPSLAAPAGDFFACGFGATSYRGLALGWDDRGGYCHLPMPCRERAHLWLHNAGDAPVQASFQVRWRPAPPPADFGALHAEFRAVDGVGDDRYEFADVEGPGKYVGIAQALQGVGDLWYLEGNEEFTVDGERQPSIRGTGTEDFYNGGWYWDGGVFSAPLHGLGVKQEWSTNRTTPWRLQLPDAVPFARRLVARIEHGSANAVRDAYYSSVAFWYGPPRPVRALADADRRPPRLWVVRPRGATGAAELQWRDAPALRRWDELTATHRGLERPLFQAFPRSHVEHEAPAFDARLALLGPGERRATFTAPFADRFRLLLRFCAPAGLPAVRIDGRALDLRGEGAPERAPLQERSADAGALAAGAHELAFAVPAGAPAPVAFDCLRLEPASPYVHAWCVAPPVPARADGTVEDAGPDEARFLADGFEPLAAGWKQVESGDSLDLNHAVSAQSPMLAYLLVFVRAPGARTARVLLGSDDGVRVWVGGVLRWSKAVHRHLGADEDQFDVPLQAGWNRVLLKVRNDYGGYGVMLRFADPDGALQVAAAPR